MKPSMPYCNRCSEYGHYPSQHQHADYVAYSVGICSASVCSSLTPDETAERLNQEHPTGIRSAWSLSPDETFRTGQSNPCPCEDSPSTHKHYLFTC